MAIAIVARSSRGSQPGERRGGRQKGTPNRTTATMRQAAAEHGLKMIERLAYLAEHAESEAVRVVAIRELLDRGYGKPRQPLTGAEEDSPIRFESIRRVIVNPGA